MAKIKNPVARKKCLPKSRGLLTQDQAAGIATVFKVLANDTRLRILHALCLKEEISQGNLAAQLGLKPQGLSNQLAKLQDLGIVATRREGIHIHYRLIDLCVSSLLDQALCLFEQAGPPGSLLNRAQICCQRVN